MPPHEQNAECARLFEQHRGLLDAHEHRLSNAEKSLYTNGTGVVGRVQRVEDKVDGITEKLTGAAMNARWTADKLILIGLNCVGWALTVALIIWKG